MDQDLACIVMQEAPPRFRMNEQSECMVMQAQVDRVRDIVPKVQRMHFWQDGESSRDEGAYA